MPSSEHHLVTRWTDHKEHLRRLAARVADTMRRRAAVVDTVTGTEIEDRRAKLDMHSTIDYEQQLLRIPMRVRLPARRPTRVKLDRDHLERMKRLRRQQRLAAKIPPNHRLASPTTQHTRPRQSLHRKQVGHLDPQRRRKTLQGSNTRAGTAALKLTQKALAHPRGACHIAQRQPAQQTNRTKTLAKINLANSSSLRSSYNHLNRRHTSAQRLYAPTPPKANPVPCHDPDAAGTRGRALRSAARRSGRQAAAAAGDPVDVGAVGAHARSAQPDPSGAALDGDADRCRSGVANAVDNLTRQAFVSEMVGADADAVSLISVMNNTARAVGPAPAGQSPPARPARDRSRRRSLRRQPRPQPVG
jgi:hypothetical protein